MPVNNFKLKALSLAVLSSISLSAFASGFQLFEYNGADVGNVNAGMAAEASDASTTFSNPAGLVRIDRPEVVLAGTAIFPKDDFKGTACGGLVVSGGGLAPCTGTPVKDQGGQDAFVPAMYFALPMSTFESLPAFMRDRMTLGLGLTAPFGLSTSWSDSKTTGFTATDSGIQTLNIGPALGLKITDAFSFGFGVDIQHMEATLKQNVKLLNSASNYSKASNNADDWAYGWNAGLLYQFTPDTRAGASFRSHIVHHLDGDSKLTTGGGLSAINSNNLGANVDLPATTVASIYHAFNPSWAGMATVSYTDWKSIQNIALTRAATVTASGSTIGTVSLPQNFDSTWRASVGADFQATDRLKLRGGLGFDETPTNTTDRTTRLPDEDRILAAVGLHYDFDKNFSSDLSYMHVFVDDADIKQNNRLNKINGDVDAYVNLVAFQFNWKFA